MTSSRLYLLFSIVLVASYSLLIYSGHEHGVKNRAIIFCPFKKLTGLPCPSCGTTRSVLLLANGDWKGAMQMNPFGIIAFMALLFLPLWLFVDTISHRQSLFVAYGRMEQWLRRSYVSFPLILVVISNWTWNILKGL